MRRLVSLCRLSYTYGENKPVLLLYMYIHLYICIYYILWLQLTPPTYMQECEYVYMHVSVIYGRSIVVSITE